MRRFAPAKAEDFSVAIDGGLLIGSAVLSQMTLHQPRLGVTRVNGENSVEKDLGDLPTFLRHCPGNVRAVNPNLRLFTATDVRCFAAEYPKNSRHLVSRLTRGSRFVKKNVCFTLQKFA
jgi:hypothetical protein